MGIEIFLMFDKDFLAKRAPMKLEMVTFFN